MENQVEQTSVPDITTDVDLSQSSDKEVRKWRETGEPPKSALKERPEHKGYSESPLEKMSWKERDEWRNSLDGKLPEKVFEEKTEGETTEAEAAPEADKTEASKPVQRTHQEAVAELPWRVARELTSAGDVEKVVEAAKQILIPEGMASALNELLADAENPGGVLRHLASDKELTSKLVRMEPMDALGVIADIDKELSREGKARREAPKVSRIPPPPSEVGGRMASTEDPVIAAGRQGMTRETKATWNAAYAQRKLRGY